MKKNIAILVGVPDCGNSEFDALPASQNDVDHMEELIAATGRWDEISTFSNPSSNEILDFLKNLAETMLM